MGNSVRFKASLDDQVSGKLAKIRDDFDRLGKSGGAKSIMQGVGLGLGVSAWGMLGSAVGKATDYMFDAITAAREEEVGIARLGSSLSANIKGWDGSTAAIEKQIDAMVRSTGFSDSEMRDSLARLVGATGDVNEAFEVQRTAMDLARYKGIDLAEASDALIRVEAGQYRALKSLGIVLEKGATQTEALAAVQKVAGGQMAAYMDTAAGKTEELGNRLEDLQEELGAKLTGPMTTATEKALGLMDAFDQDVPLTFMDRLNGVADAVNSLNPAMWNSNINAGILRTGLEKNEKAAYDAAREMDTYAEKNAEARNPTIKLDKANRNLAGSLNLVAQSGAAALEAVQNDIDALRELRYIRRAKGNQSNARASGGPVVAGQVYTVGERGPETLVMGDRSGYVIPNGAAPSRGSTPVSIPIILDGREIARVVDRHLYYAAARAPQTAR